MALVQNMSSPTQLYGVLTFRQHESSHWQGQHSLATGTESSNCTHPSQLDSFTFCCCGFLLLLRNSVVFSKELGSSSPWPFYFDVPSRMLQGALFYNTFHHLVTERWKVFWKLDSCMKNERMFFSLLKWTCSWWLVHPENIPEQRVLWVVSTVWENHKEKQSGLYSASTSQGFIAALCL